MWLFKNTATKNSNQYFPNPLHTFPALPPTLLPRQPFIPGQIYLLTHISESLYIRFPLSGCASLQSLP